MDQNENSSSVEKNETSKSEVVRQLHKKGKTIHFANLMDLCHIKKAEFAKYFQKYKGVRCVLEEQRQRRRRTQSSICRATCISVSDDCGQVLGQLLKASLVWLEKQVTQFQRILKSE